jgi:hypothetical protein
VTPSRALRRLLVAMLAASSSSCRSSAGDAPPELQFHSHVVLFAVDTPNPASTSAADAVLRRVAERCRDPELTKDLGTEIGRFTAGGSVRFVDSVFQSYPLDQDKAWDAPGGGKPTMIVDVKLRPAEASKTCSVGASVLASIGWLLCGVPGFVVDEFEYRLPVQVDVRLWRRDGAKGSFSMMDEVFSTDYIDRNVFVSAPYFLTILVPPVLVSCMDLDDVDETANVLFRAAIERLARRIAGKIAELEKTSARSSG